LDTVPVFHGAQSLEPPNCSRTRSEEDHSIREYTRQEIDKLTSTQRERLFAADPEMAAWWRGKSLISGAWPLFRLRGGTWLSEDQIGQTPAEHGDTVWKILGLLDWYMKD
jgi:hypothetical protein